MGTESRPELVIVVSNISKLHARGNVLTASAFIDRDKEPERLRMGNVQLARKILANCTAQKQELGRNAARHQDRIFSMS